ncbi:MAG: class I SAM-dependent methyltransferase [Nitrososphaerales archaeon]|jgi:ubiquinone/menaquinone biosynthesis C-methylase UbiE
MSLYDRAHFGIIRFVHETLYRAAVDPYDWLRDSGVVAGQRVLEVGCGPGFFTLPAAELVGDGGSMVALDNNPAAVDFVGRKIRRHGTRNARAILADAARTGLPEGSQDLVFLYGVIHALWGNLDEVLAEANRVLEPGGALSVSTSGVPRARLVEAVVGSKRFRLKGATERVVNFESVPSSGEA